MNLARRLSGCSHRRALRTGAACIAGMLLSGPVLTASGAEGGAGGNPWMDLLWKAVNFVILVAVIGYFARKPVANMLKGATQSTKAALDGTRESALAARSELDEQRRRIENLEAELERLRGEALAEARVERERLLAEARAGAERIKAAVQVQVEQEFNKARNELKRQLAVDTVAQAEALIRARLDAEGQQRLASRAIDRLGAP